jgi:hypothetical protein
MGSFFSCSFKRHLTLAVQSSAAASAVSAMTVVVLLLLLLLFAGTEVLCCGWQAVLSADGMACQR